MRVTDRGTTLVIEDAPGCVWIFGAWFVAGGLLALTMPLFAQNRDEIPGWAKLAVLVMGGAAVAVGLATIRKSPTTRTEIDAASDRVRVVTRVPFGRSRVEEFSLGDIGVVQVLPTRDGDGVEQYTLRLLLRDGREIPLHAQPSYGKRSIQRDADRIREYLGRVPA